MTVAMQRTQNAATPASPPMPNFFIIGAAKSGTTSLANYLGGHPDVFMPKWKEPAYFTSPEIPGLHDWNGYLQLFQEGRGVKAIGEASTHYLSSPEAPGMIKDAYGDTRIKLIAILRNPVDMMYSHWAHIRRLGWEHRSAEKALLGSFKEPVWDPARWFLLHAHRVRYFEQLSRYYELFGKDDIKIYLFEEFFADVLPNFMELCRFLDIRTDYVPILKTHNEGYRLRSDRLQRIIAVHYGKYVLPIVKYLIPPFIRQSVGRRITQWNNGGAKPLAPMDEHLRSEMQELLTPGVRNLETLLGRNLSKVWF
ncbi:MAG: sulfotransferase, partial [Desulfovibrionaceae bacterium]